MIIFHSSLQRHNAADNKTMKDADGTTDAVPIDLPLTRYPVVSSVTSQHSALYKQRNSSKSLYNRPPL